MRVNPSVVLAVFLILAAAYGVLYAAGSGHSGLVTTGLVRAERFELIDSSGAERGAWYYSEDGSSGIALWDQRGTMRILLDFTSEDGEGLTLRDHTGKIAAWVGIGRDGNPSVHLFDKQERPRCGLELNGDGSAEIGIYDGEGKALVTLTPPDVQYPGS